MSGKELMIGDWVCYKNDNKYHQISSVNMQRDGSVLIAIENDLSFDYMFEPIPIKRIHLTKNGFKAKDIEDSLFVFRNGYTITVQFDEGINDTENDLNIPPMAYLSIKFAEKDIWIPIEYIHELQHTMKLFGIDKEIEL